MDVFKCFFFLPKFTLLFLSRNFNNSRFVDDTRGALSFLHNTNNPSLITFLLFDVFAISSGLFPRQTNKKTSRGLSRMALQKLEHVSTFFGYSCHFGNDWQIVDDEGNFILLVSCQCLSVT